MTGMSALERAILRMVAYALYLTGVAGAAYLIGGWGGFLVLAVAGGVPLLGVLRADADQREADRAVSAYRPDVRSDDLPPLNQP